jgi:hypothetical protein
MRLAAPAFLHLQRVPLRALLVTGLLSYGLQIAAIIQHYPLWLIVLVTLVPWFPLFAFEAIWKYQHYGHLAIFAASVVVQLGFLVESSAQLVGLYSAGAAAYHPDPEIPQLIRTVGLWVGCNILLTQFFQNRWVWAAWVVASVHLINGLYIASTMFFDPAFYRTSGSAGLFAAGGLLGTPLARPYVEFLFGYLQLIPLVIGIVIQAGHAYDQFLAKAMPGLGESELIATTGRLHRLTAPAGTVIIRQGEIADRFFVLAHGEVEVVREDAAGERRVATLQPGQFFGEIGLLTPDARRTATVRSVTPVELLTLDRDAFTALLQGSSQPEADLKTEVAKRLAELEGRA